MKKLLLGITAVLLSVNCVGLSMAAEPTPAPAPAGSSVTVPAADTTVPKKKHKARKLRKAKKEDKKSN